MDLEIDLNKIIQEKAKTAGKDLAKELSEYMKKNLDNYSKSNSKDNVPNNIERKNIKQENNITPATTQTKPFTSSTTIASTTTTSINTTTTTQPTTTSTIETEVLGQAQTNTSSLPPADVRVKEENIIV